MAWDKEKRKADQKVWRETNKEKIKAYYRVNKEKIIANQKNYRELNKEKIKAYQKAYCKANKEKRKINQKVYYKMNKEKIRTKQKAYCKANKEKRKVYYIINKKKVKSYQKAYREFNKEKIRFYNILRKKEENKRRKKLGLPLINEHFRSEMELMFYVSRIFEGEMITTHNREVLDGLELDIYIPSFKLAFEYQGIQHYKIDNFLIKTREQFQALQFRDRRKKELCKEKGIILIEIRYNEKLSEQLVLKKLKDYDFQLKQKRL